MENKYSVYRQIRYNRTFRPLGKMSWWRVVLGILLLVAVFLISGVVSQRVAARGNFTLAETLMVSPQWMEKHKPEVKAFIEAGVLYQNGEYKQAADSFEMIEGVDAAPVMKCAADIKLAKQYIEAKDFENAFAIVDTVDVNYLSEENTEEFVQLCTQLREYFVSEKIQDKADIIADILSLVKES